jgi:hypothetical protein
MMMVGGASRAVVAEQKRQIRKQIEQDQRDKARAALRALRDKIRGVKAHRKEAMKEAVAFCRAERVRAREKAKERAGELRRRAREEIRLAHEEEKIAARATCSTQKEHVRSSELTDREKARGELRAERAFQAEMKRIEQRQRKASRPRRTALERRQESDDEVRGNLPPDLLPLFERVKRQIRATDRMSRTEAFLKYAEENPAEVYAEQERRAEQEIRELMRQETRLAKAVDRRKPPTEAELAAIPF